MARGANRRILACQMYGRDHPATGTDDRDALRIDARLIRRVP
jgi:hypothetical protein